MITTVRMDKESGQASKKYWAAFANEAENTKVKTSWIMPELIGDVAYRSTFNNDILHTGFIRAVRRKSKSEPQNVISDDVGDIPAEELYLSISLIDPVIK